jgi:hypothetical protein
LLPLNQDFFWSFFDAKKRAQRSDRRTKKAGKNLPAESSWSKLVAPMKKAASIARYGLFNFNPATTYVPTQLPVQYHRPGEA